MSSGSRREISVLLLAILFALILLALLLLLLPPWGAEEEPEPPVEEAARREVPPEEVVARELMKREELIPFEGTLGGTMGFYTRENITVLNDRWVFARFEDGHIRGSMLLEYRLSPTGELQWEILAAELD